MQHRSLVEHGVEPTEDEALRHYFSLPTRPPARSSLLARLFNAEHRELEQALASFYASGLVPYAVASKWVASEHEKTFPEEPRPTLTAWVRQVYGRDARGETNHAECVLLEKVALEASVPLGALVRAYKKRRDTLRSEEARAAREGAVARLGEAAKTRPPPTRRRQDLTMPEVIVFRPRPR